MKKNIFTVVIIFLIIPNFAYGRAIPNILISPDNQHEYDIQIIPENSMILHPHTESISFKIDCPYQIKEFFFKNAILNVFHESDIICRVEIASFRENNRVSGQVSIAADQINNCKLYINYQDKEYQIKQFFINLSSFINKETGENN